MVYRDSLWTIPIDIWLNEPSSPLLNNFSVSFELYGTILRVSGSTMESKIKNFGTEFDTIIYFKRSMHNLSVNIFEFIP